MHLFDNILRLDLTLNVLLLRRSNSTEEASGYGYELTIKIKIDQANTSENKRPPTWPFKLMQCLARYTFNNGILFGHLSIYLRIKLNWIVTLTPIHSICHKFKPSQWS